MNKMFFCLVSAAVAVFFAGCGGGNTSNSAYSFDTSKRAAITTANAPFVASSVVGGTTSDEGAIGGGILSHTDSPDYSKSKSISEPLKAVIELTKISKERTEIKKYGEIGKRESRKLNCSGGGSISYSGDGKSHVSIEYNSCREGDFLINGKADITSTSSGSTMVLSNLTVKSSSFDATYYNAKLVISSESYSYSTLDYDMTAQITLFSPGMSESATYRFQSFKLKVEGLENSSDSISYEIDGDMSTPCTDGWVNVDTTEKIIQVKSDQCPSAGVVKITGVSGSEVTWRAGADGSVTVETNGQINTYETCRDVPNGC